ncbi:MAG: tRNA(Ile)-lysidine synthetase, partial [Candidatus Eremiobacteraeota bacterium]|nr:tRNA(Ile)-lysidine synthetase [Candidatus Eremiobacteraeota bacterium]
MRGARHERSVEDAIVQSGAIAAGDRVLVACSGGPDSVALAAGLHAVAERLSLKVAIGFVNHGLRASAWQDECIVLELAARLDLTLDVTAPAIASSDEQAMREARYAALADAATRRECNVIATAHHAEDQS